MHLFLVNRGQVEEEDTSKEMEKKVDSQMLAYVPASLLGQAFMIISGAPCPVGVRWHLWLWLCRCTCWCLCVCVHVCSCRMWTLEVRVLKEQHSPGALERTVWQPKSHWGKLSEVHFT